MKFRTIVEDYEARLVPAGPPEAQNARGKVEWELFGDGDRELELSFRGLEIEGPVLLDMLLNGSPIGQCEVKGGRGRFRMRMSEGTVPPSVHASDKLSISRTGIVLLEGIFETD